MDGVPCIEKTQQKQKKIKQALFSDLLGTFLLCRILNGHTVTRCSKESNLIWDFKKRIRDFSNVIV